MTENPTATPRTTLDRLTAGREDRAALDTSVPLRPGWARDRASFRAASRITLRRARYRTARFLMQVPVLLGLLLAYSPRGLARLTKALAGYLYDNDSAEVRHVHAGAGETKEYLAAERARSAHLRARWMVAGTGLLVIAGPVLAWTAPSVLSALVGAALCVWVIKLIPGRGLTEVGVGVGVGGATWYFLPKGLALIPTPPAWPFAVAGCAAVLALGWHGRPIGRPIVKDLTGKNGGGRPPLRADLIVEALCSLGNSKMKDPDAVQMVGDLHRNGPGVQGEFDLPRGVTAKYVMENREELAAAMRYDLGTVWPSVGKQHPGRLVMFVSDEVLAEAVQEQWPLLKGGEVDLFRPVPQFTDQRGSWVEVMLAYANVIIGAVPRMGKTFVLRQLALVAALDKRARLYVYDGKGTGDLAPLALVAHSYVRGARTDKPEQIEKVRADLAELRREMGRRADLLDSLPREVVPESKVTSELANARPDLRLGPIVVVMDETQSYFSYGSAANKEHKGIRQEIEEGMTELVKLGPALGIVVILATQQVNKDTIPPAIANNAVIRFCMKMEGYEPNDRVLGTGAYKRGIDATMFDIDDKGIGILKAEGGVPRIVRSVFGLDAVAAEKVAARARGYREAAGLLTGQAAGEVDAPVMQVDLLADCRDVLDSPEGGRSMSLAGLVDRLPLLRPGVWGHLDAEALGSALRAVGVRPASVYCRDLGKTGQGIKREWLDVAEGEGGSVTPLRPSAS